MPRHVPPNEPSCTLNKNPDWPTELTGPQKDQVSKMDCVFANLKDPSMLLSFGKLFHLSFLMALLMSKLSTCSDTDGGKKLLSKQMRITSDNSNHFLCAVPMNYMTS